MKVVRLKPLLLAIFIIIVFCLYVLFCIVFFVFALLCLFCFFLWGEGVAEQRNHFLDKNSTPQTFFQPAI